MSDVTEDASNGVQEGDGSNLDTPLGPTIIIFRLSNDCRQKLFQLMKKKDFFIVSEAIEWAIQEIS